MLLLFRPKPTLRTSACDGSAASRGASTMSPAAGLSPRHRKPRRLSACGSMRSRSWWKVCSTQALRPGPTDAALAAEAIDITLPGSRRLTGAEHPITKTLNEITSVFAALGYSVGVGPEVETDFYNFESMNFPHGHPARDTQDTLVVANQERRPLRDRLLLRTHTSPCKCARWSCSRRRCGS
jgi:phenylalanyl-tRNA synthetase alpha subunit